MAPSIVISVPCSQLPRSNPSPRPPSIPRIIPILSIFTPAESYDHIAMRTAVHDLLFEESITPGLLPFHICQMYL